MKRILLVAAVVTSAVALAACGSSTKSSPNSNSSASNASPTPTPTGTTTHPHTSSAPSSSAKVSIEADPSGALKFRPVIASAPAGQVTLEFINPSPISHGLSLQGNGVNKTGSVVGKGATTSLTATLKAGKYTFYCPVPGHRQAGMVGTLTVR